MASAKRNLSRTYMFRGQFYGPGQGVEVPNDFPAPKDEAAQDGGTSGGLAEDFPVGELLTEAGYDSPEKVRAASDEDLLALDGVGEATLKKIRAAQG